MNKIITLTLIAALALTACGQNQNKKGKTNTEMKTLVA